MRNSIASLRVASLGCVSFLFLLGTVGCKESTGNDSTEDGETEAPEWEGEPGQEAQSHAAYPAGPYGNEVGRVAPNYKFAGFADPLNDKTSATYIEFADFYNPTGTEVYPEGSKFGAGKAKPKALLVTVSAVWCGPCQYENDVVLPEEYAAYAPRGAQFLLQLSDGPTVGDPAKFSHLVNWTNKYDTAWPAVIDPSSKLSELFEAQAFPANIIIDTKTMTIVESIAGVPEPGSAFFVALEGLLDPA